MCELGYLDQRDETLVFKPDVVLLETDCFALIAFSETFFCIIVFTLKYSFLLSQPSQPEADKVNFHFIAFVNVNGQLYEFGK